MKNRSENTLQQRLAGSFQKNTDRIALDYGAQSITYSELEKKAAGITNAIIAAGIKKESNIGIYIDDRVGFIAAMIGIMNAGGVFVPLDPEQPAGRIRRMISTAGTETVICERTNKNQCLSTAAGLDMNIRVITLEEAADDKVGNNIENAPEDKLYIYYTSGSTGEPRPIQGKNKSLLHFINWEIETFGIDETHRFSQLAAPGFDALLKDVLVPLSAGARVCIPERRDIVMDGHKLREWIEKSRITVLQTVPTIFRQLNSNTHTPGDYKGLEYILLAGEKLTPRDFTKWYEIFDERIQLVNLYGPTETTILKTFHFITKADVQNGKIPIGKPMKGARVMILDSQMNVCGKGIAGEIYIRTPYMTYGYYNDPKLTQERYIPNPFTHDPADRFYKTGDQGRIMPDGNIEFIGRQDRQVKIRGVRVELEEIEAVLREHEAINAAAVKNWETEDGEPILCAYYENGKPGKEQDVEELREYLAGQLPLYMHPAHYVSMEKIPRTVSGKIDWKALPQPGTEEPEKYEAPRNEIEEKLQEIWSEVLQLEKRQIGIDTDFFQEGGQSLRATVMAAKIHKALEVKYPLEKIFKHATIRKQAAYIEQAVKHTYTAIEPAEKKEYYRLSSAQKRIYLLQQADTAHIGYNMPKAFMLEGTLEIEKFKDIFRQLVARHENYRTTFDMIDGEVVQQIHEDVHLEIEYYERKEEKDQKDGHIDPDKIMENFIRPFDLTVAPLQRVGLIKMDDRRHILMVDQHHIISDGTSLGIYITEFMALYNGERLPEKRIQYKDNAQWQVTGKQKDAVRRQEAYWHKQLEGEIPQLDLPVDYLRTARQNFEGATVETVLEQEQADALRKLAQEEGATLYMVLLAIYYVQLHKLTGRDDIVVGTPTAGRNHENQQDLIGMFLNTLAMRNKPAGQKTFRRFLAEVKENQLKAFENQEYQFEDLVEKLGIKNEPGRNPLFDVMFLLHNEEFPEVEIPGLKLKATGKQRTTTKFDLSLYAQEFGPEIQLNINYRTKLFKPATIEKFTDIYKNIVTTVLENPDVKLAEIVAYTRRERDAQLEYINRDLQQEAAEIMGNETHIQEKLKGIFERYPDKAAVTMADKTLTYGELDRRSNIIANKLLAKKIKKGTFIGVLMNNRQEQITVLVGIVKAGSVMVPLYRGYPDERLKAMMQTTDLKYIFIDEENARRFEAGGDMREEGRELIHIEDFYQPGETGKFADSPHEHYDPEDPLYIHFTSGTTGTPKAVVGKNRGFQHFINWEIHTMKIADGTHVSQFTIPGFDPYLRDIYAPLTAGGTICIPEKEEMLLDHEELTRWIEKNRINLIHLVPSLFRQLNTYPLTPENYKHLKYILLAGEKTTPTDLVRWYEIFGPRIQLVNCYGPTETTMSKVHYHIQPEDVNRERIPIGEPQKGSRIIILDENQRICDPLEPGEICILTPYGSNGYHGDDEQNTQKFIRHPQVSKGKIYRSGDQGRILLDGNIDILGRIDRQIKIRGYRVELEEIETVMISDTAVKEAVVIKRDYDDNIQMLCGYITLQDPEATKPKELLHRLNESLYEKLPEYMVPANIVIMEKMPKRATGKVDYHQLPDPVQSKGEDYIAPQTPIQQRLAKLWSGILKTGETGINKSFFQVGGSSLNAMTLVSKIHKEFNVKIPLEEIFKKPTIKEQAEIIMTAGEDRFVSIEAVEKKEYYTLSSAQKRLYALHQKNRDGMNYNIPRSLVLEGELDKEKLERTFAKQVNRHESFRTEIHVIDGEPVQKIHDNVEFKIETGDISDRGVKDMEPAELEKIIKGYIKPFDLSQAPLLRVTLLKLGHNSHQLIMDMHHIVIDAPSIVIFVKEFVEMYEGREHPPLKIQYKDYAAWQETRKAKGELKQQEEYWKKQFAGEIPVLHLPLDYARPAIQSVEGDREYFEISDEDTGALRKMAGEQGVTMYILLLAVYSIFLYKLSNQEDIVVGVAPADRRHADLEPIVGIFVNMLAMRTNPSPGKTFKGYLEEIKKTALEAFQNQDYQFEDLVKTVVQKRDMSRNPLFDVVFMLEKIDIGEASLPGLTLKAYEFERMRSKHDLMLTAVENDEKIGFTLEYCTKLFKRETIDIYVTYFKKIITILRENPDIEISEIEVISDKKREAMELQFTDDLEDE